MGDEAAGSGQHDVGTCLERTALLLVAHAVVAAIHGHSIDPCVVGKALQGLVDLARQLTGGRNDQAVDRVGRMFVALQQGEQGEQVGCRLARSGLGHTQHVAVFEYGRNAARLYGCAFLKAHVVERIEHIVRQVEVFKEYFFVWHNGSR